MHTSILRPSTTVPWSFSRARSASALLANVTKPNPCMPRQKRTRMEMENDNTNNDNNDKQQQRKISEN